MTEESQKTFFSYARADSAFVLRLVKDLRAAGADVWLDQLDIGPGEHWDSAVENALRICPCHVTVLSPEAVSSQNVMDEVSYALEEHKQIIPLFYRDCTVPFRLRRVQWVDFRTDYTSGFRNLAGALRIKGAPAVPAAPIEPVEGVQTHPVTGGQVAAAIQTAGMVEQRGSRSAIDEAEVLEEGRREEVRVAVLPHRVWREPKKLWIAGAVVVALALVIWMMSGSKPQHDSVVGHEFTPTATPAAAAPERTPTIQPPSEKSGGGADLSVRTKGHPAKQSADKSVQDSGSAKQPIAPTRKTIGVCNNPAADAAFQQGMKYSYKKVDVAIGQFTQAAQLDPGCLAAFARRGYAYTINAKYDLAIHDFNHVLQIEPRDSLTYTRRGNAYALKGQQDRAIQDFNEALKLDPRNEEAYYRRGVSYYQQKEFDLALRDYNMVLQLDPRNDDAKRGHDLVLQMTKESQIRQK